MMRLWSTMRGWRTVLVNVLLAIMPALELAEVTDVLPDAAKSWYVLLVALANLWLRTITTTPIGIGKRD